ncbi:YeiH family protein [Pisciglobus halotolerans]|uniref:Conserved hypothetical integral membrane protein n=1 Tax=Pisciglobus halotolerans TaxID=745365 RepID=A0A1I3BPF4_9LACT|nr:putative sulfate exporter family transporter [Pisciglobus halotolerans]SFH63671.1 conserved hypothetical integral membrane protein [Pisciglobus halotolerans]
MEKIKQELNGIGPGLTISIVISLVAQLLAQVLPSLGSALIAIFLGIILGNTIFTGQQLDSGTKFSEKRLLEYSIVLNGLILDFQMIQSAGVKGFFFIALNMCLTIFFVYQLGRWFGFNKKFALLMGAGNAVCGSSAIGTVSPIVEADDKDKGISITIVNVTGTFLMIVLPLVTALLYQNAALPTGALIGGSVQSIGQVIASAKMVSDDAVSMATVFKLMRVLLIMGVALVYSRMNVEEDGRLFTKKNAQETTKEKKVSVGIPWFIIGFFILFIVRSLNFLPAYVLEASKWISTQFEVIALGAIGMRVKFADIIKEGQKSLTYGLIVGTLQILLGVLLIHAFFG